MKRCVITGMGAVTPVGNTVSEFWESLKNGVSGIDYIKSFDTSDCKAKIAAEIKNFDPEHYVSKKDTKRNDKFSLYALAAASQAMEASGIKEGAFDPFRFGVIVSSGIGGLGTIEEQIIRMHDRGPGKVSPLFIPMAIANMAAGNIAIRFGAKGICTSIVTACASGTNSIGEAFRNIRFGYLDLCLAGGAEASITKSGLSGFTNLQALTLCPDPKTACRPFDKQRSGFVMGDGSGVLLLEELEHAKKRGATIYAEVVGYGATGDAYHITSPAPDGEGASAAMRMAMQEAEITPDLVTYINAHGTSTGPNDSSETNAIKKVFGKQAYHIPISSTKSMTGHLLGAAGAIEAIACVKALEDDFAPPTINYQDPDPECDLDYIPNTGRHVAMRYALSNSFGFGGHNAVLCLKKWEETV